LSELAVLADCAKGFEYCQRRPTPEERAYAGRNHAHHNYHYTDVPIQQTQYRAGTAGTSNHDVVQVIRNAVQVLRGLNPPKDVINLTETEALFVLVHLVGDIHQPLHVGAVYYDHDCEQIVDPNVVGAGRTNFGIDGIVLGTTGGNDLMTTATQNLHHFWDSTAVNGAARIVKSQVKASDAFAAAIIMNPPAGRDTPGQPDTWPERWATESLVLATDALSGPEPEFDDATQKVTDRGTTCTAPVSIDKDYKTSANQIALQQLGKAGFRLNALLVAIFEGR
jgi:hypothetical protein